MTALGHWQGSTFVLAPALTLQTLNGQPLAGSSFPQQACVLDATQVNEIDSIGVAAILNLYRMARQADVALHLQGANAALARLLDLYALDCATLGQSR